MYDISLYLRKGVRSGKTIMSEKDKAIIPGQKHEKSLILHNSCKVRDFFALLCYSITME